MIETPSSFQWTGETYFTNKRNYCSDTYQNQFGKDYGDINHLIRKGEYATKKLAVSLNFRAKPIIPNFLGRMGRTLYNIYKLVER